MVKTISTLFKNCLGFLLLALSLGACTYVYDYNAEGMKNSSDRTTIYEDNERDVRILMSGLNYFINFNPKFHQAIVEVDIGHRNQKITVYPNTLKIALINKGKSLLFSDKVKNLEIYSNLSLCEKELYPYAIREKGLPTSLEVDSICNLNFYFAYNFEMPRKYNEVLIRVTFEYEVNGKKIFVDEKLPLSLNKWKFWWIYIT